MRKVASTRRREGGVQRVVLHQTDLGTYLYLSRTRDDAGSFADEWYETTADAEAVAREKYGIAANEWQAIEDPAPGCRHDCVIPRRI